MLHDFTKEVKCTSRTVNIGNRNEQYNSSRNKDTGYVIQQGFRFYSR